MIRHHCTRLLTLALVLLAACSGSRRAAQLQTAATLRPAGFEAARAPAAETRPVTLRVYVDPGYRALLDWRGRVEDLIARANEVVGPRFGIHFVAAEVRPWEHGAASGDLRTMLAELHRTEPAPDADWVVGLTAGGPVTGLDLEELGMAWLLGRYWMLRAVDDTREAQAFAATLSALEPFERERLLRERRRHKELVVFLHEWGHTLGLPHMSGEANVMNPAYSPRQGSFGQRGGELAEIALRHRMPQAASAEARTAYAEELALYLDSATGGDWGPTAREELLALLERRPAPAERASAGVAPSAMSREEMEAFAAALTLAKQKKTREAFSRLATAGALATNEPLVARFACELAASDRTLLRQGVAICRRATGLAPDDPGAWTNLGFALAGAEDREGAFAALLEARDQIGGEGATRERLWLNLARLAHDLEAVSLAEEAAARGGEGAEAILDWARATRRRMALPPDAQRFGVEAREEPGYLSLVRRGLLQLGAKRLEQVAALASEGRQRFPGAPGPAILDCAAAVAREDCAAARLACGEALQAWDEASLAHFQLGVCALREGRLRDAEAQMTRVVELSPDVRSAWKNLAFILRASDRMRESRALEERYRARFGAAL